MDQNDSMKTEDLSFGSIFKIVFWAGMCSWSALALIGLLLAVISPQSISMNGVQATNFAEALPIVPFVLLVGLILSALGAAIGSGLLKAVAKFLPLGSIRRS